RPERVVMNNIREFDQELAELKGFIAELKADRAAQKEKERSEAWTKYTAVSLVFIAVLAAIATQWAGKYSSRVLVGLNDSTFNQAKASDQWSYYQAKSIKQNHYEAFRDTSSAAVDANQTLEMINSKIAKYELDKTNIMAEAKALEKLRDQAREAAARAGDHGTG